MFDDGFIPGSRGSFFLDFLACSLVFIVLFQATSGYLVKFKRLYSTHKTMQMALSTILLVLIILFELEIRLIGWKHRAADSPFFDAWLMPLLIVHILIAVIFLLAWVTTMKGAYSNFQKPPRPNFFSSQHRRQAKVSILAMLGTVVSGWLFYYLAFIAT